MSTRSGASGMAEVTTPSPVGRPRRGARQRLAAALATLLIFFTVSGVRGADAPAAGDLGPGEAFVTAAYTDFLGRTPTPSEIAFLTVNSMASASTRGALVSQLSRSSEWIRVTVDRLYADTLGRPGDAGGTAFWISALSSGRYRVAQVAAMFYSSDEYYTGFGGSDDRTWVSDLYRKVLLRDPGNDQAGVDFWVGRTVSRGRTAVALDFYQSLESRRTRVAGLYQQLLGRKPDPEGWQYWAAVIITRGDLALAANLAGSFEYYARAADRFGDGLPPIPARLDFTRTWVTNLGAGRMVVRSSPAVASIDAGAPVVVVGDQGGYVNALRLTDGSGVWAASTSGAAADSTVSVVGAGPGVRIYAGVGNSANPTVGGYLALGSTGNRLWFRQPRATPSGGKTGVMSSMTVGNFQGTDEVVSGSMGQMAYAMNAQGGVLFGFPWFEADSSFATPATLDVDGNGSDEIVMGGDSTAGVAFGHTYSNGGALRIVSGRGNGGSSNESAGQRCRYDANQVVQSSPAVGRFLPGGAVGIVAGTGTYFSGASDTNRIIAVDTNCRLRWKADLHAATSASPALADVRGDGTLAVIAGTRSGPDQGSVYALNGANGARIWSTSLPGGVYGGIATADLRGTGSQDVVVATPTGVYVLDGRTGAVIGQFGQGFGLQNTVLITRDPNGDAGITIAGYNGRREGVVAHYVIDQHVASFVGGVGGWPMFHHDPKLSGNASNPT